MLSQVYLPGQVEPSEREPHRAQVVASLQSPAQRREWLMRNVKTIGYV